MKPALNLRDPFVDARVCAETSQIPPVQTGWFKEVLAQRREYVYQHDFLIEYGRAVPAPGRKMEHVARLRDPLFASDGEAHAPSLDQRDLLVRVVVRRRDDVRLEAKAADHQSLAHYHLAAHAAAEVFDGDVVPVPMIHRCFSIQIHRPLYSKLNAKVRRDKGSTGLWVFFLRQSSNLCPFDPLCLTRKSI